MLLLFHRIEIEFFISVFAGIYRFKPSVILSLGKMAEILFDWFFTRRVAVETLCCKAPQIAWTELTSRRD